MLFLQTFLDKFHLLRNPNHNNINADYIIAVYLNKFLSTDRYLYIRLKIMAEGL